MTVEDVAAACAADPRARELDALLRERGTSRGRVLGDASKARIVGRDRVHKQIVKVGQVPGSHTYYDLPARRGYDARRLIVPYRTLRAALRAETFDALAQEYKAAGRLSAGSTSPSPRRSPPYVSRSSTAPWACSSATRTRSRRRVTCWATRRGRPSSGTCAASRRRAGTSPRTRRRRSRWLASASRRSTRLAATSRADPGGAAPAAHGRGVHGVDPPRPAERAHRPGAARRCHGPDPVRQPRAHARRSDEDGRRAAVTAVDRVDALLHLAEKLAARTLTFLHGGADLLGGGLRDAVLPAQLLASKDERLWARGLAALALLG